MVDTTKTKAELLNIFRDGQETGSISEQDLRDFIMTLYDPKDGTTIPAGTLTEAGLKLTEGVRLTTPQDGAFEYADGHLYFINGSRKSFDMSDGVKTDTTTVTNTITETIVFSHTIVPDALHLDERVFADVSGSYSNDSASDDFVIRAKINGVTVHTINRTGGNVTNSGWKLQMEGTIRSIGVSGSFIDLMRFEDGTNIYTEALAAPGPIDTTIATVYEVTVEWGAAKTGNTFSCTQGSVSYQH